MEYNKYTHCKFLVFYSFLLYWSSIMTTFETIFNLYVFIKPWLKFEMVLDKTCKVTLFQPWAGPAPVHCILSFGLILPTFALVEVYLCQQSKSRALILLFYMPYYQGKTFQTKTKPKQIKNQTYKTHPNKEAVKLSALGYFSCFYYQVAKIL